MDRAMIEEPLHDADVGDDVEPEPYPEPPVVGDQGGSILERLAARREAMAREESPHLDVDVPGYALEPGGPSALVLRCRYPDGGWKVITDAIERAQNPKNPEGALYGNADVLIACCHEVLGRERDGALVPLDPSAEPGEPPLRLTTKLGELLHIETPAEVKSKGRHVVRHLFSPRAQASGVFDGDLMLMTTGGRVITWLQGERSRLDEDFAGE